MSHNITVEGGSSVRLKTAGKYCDRDIVVTATGGGGSDRETALIQRTLAEYSNNELTYIGPYSFSGFDSLASINLPNMTSAGQYALSENQGLTSVAFPALEKIPQSFMRRCLYLERADFSKITSIGSYGFYQCGAQDQHGFTTLIIRTDVICTLSNTNAFTGTKIASGEGYVYIPRALADSYKTATNWSTYAAQFRAIEDYPEITGG